MIEFTISGHVPDMSTLMRMIDAMHDASPSSAEFTVHTKYLKGKRHAKPEDEK